MQHAMQRQALYADFIVEASKRLTEAWNHQADGPEVIAGLYPTIARMRLTSSSEIIKRAEQVIRHIIAAYADPNRTFDEFKQHVQDPELADPLRDFTEERGTLDSAKHVLRDPRPVSAPRNAMISRAIGGASE